MPNPEQLEYAEVLLTKADGDLAAGKALADRDEIADDIVGFHAQQAVEKAIKAVLTLIGVDYPRTHDIRYLVDQLRQSGSTSPPVLDESAWLTAWATEFRYVHPPPPSLDREAALATADAAIAWARSELAKQEGQ